MKDPKHFEVSGKKYVVLPLTGRKAMELDRMVCPLLFGLGREASKGLSKYDLSLLLSKILGNMPEDEFERLRALTFSGVTFAGSDTEKSISLAGEECYDHFNGRLMDLYYAMLEAWGAHELTPFRMMAGSLTEETA